MASAARYTDTRDLFDYPDRPKVPTAELPVGSLMVWMECTLGILHLSWGKLERHFDVDWVLRGTELSGGVYLDQGSAPIQATDWVKLTEDEAQLLLWMSEMLSPEGDVSSVS